MKTEKINISKIAKRVMQAMTFTREDYKSQLYLNMSGVLSEWMKKRISIKNSVLKGNVSGWTREVNNHARKLEFLLESDLRHGDKKKAAFEALEEFFEDDLERISNRSYNKIKRYSKEKKEKFKEISWDNEDMEEFKTFLTNVFNRAFS